MSVATTAPHTHVETPQNLGKGLHGQDLELAAQNEGVPEVPEYEHGREQNRTPDAGEGKGQGNGPEDSKATCPQASCSLLDCRVDSPKDVRNREKGYGEEAKRLYGPQARPPVHIKLNAEQVPGDQTVASEEINNRQPQDERG